MIGTFREESTHPHVALRRLRLGHDHGYPFPSTPAHLSSSDPDAIGRRTRAQLVSQGVALVALDRPMTTSEFIAFGALLGVAQPERSSAVQPYVDEGVILNLVAGRPATSDPDMQPFAANWLSIHTESSRVPAGDQPRFIALLCVAAGLSGQASTVLVPMHAVFEALSETDRAILAETRYADSQGSPTFLREERGRPVFSVRDFQGTPLRWEYCGSAATTPAAVNSALTKLFAAMYDCDCFGVTWRPGLLVVFDNAEYFHGRTAGGRADDRSPRHLRRLRLAEAAS
ncbi:TauD/TfdA family dioxygenase [Nocardia sp. NPDC058114]|uniref:TauD/TfdA family dioxygenase n=1 Tax=Nocardia sp. NPDC058114 TaxID=3346346 RepID=UPI0036DD5EBA